jgi:hypothetical protein
METIEIKKVQNGFHVVVKDETEFDEKEYVFTKESQVIKFLKEQFKEE